MLNEIPSAEHNSELEGAATPNQHYVGSRLVYKDGEAESLDPVNARFIKALRVHWAIVAVITLIGVVVLGLFWGVIAESPRIAGFATGVWLLVMGVVAWWFPILVSISEWRFMVDDKAMSSSAAFEHIKWAFSERRSPVEQIRVHRLSLGKDASRDYLYVQDNVFRAYIACFPYGRDLYVGWTLWWRLSAARWMWTIIKRHYEALTLRGSELHTVHRYDSAKALREAVHGAARQGLDAATGVVSFRTLGTAGSGIAVDHIDALRGQEPGLPGFGSSAG